MNLPEIHGYVYWLLLAEESNRMVEQWIEKLRKRIPIPCFLPHLTLCRAPEELNEKELMDICGSIASGTPVLQLDTTGLGGKHHPYQSLYIKINPSSSLLSLRSELTTSMGAKKEPGYNPHISLVYGQLKNEEREKLKEEIKIETGTRFLADRIGLIKLEGQPLNWSVVDAPKLRHITD